MPHDTAIEPMSRLKFRNVTDLRDVGVTSIMVGDDHVHRAFHLTKLYLGETGLGATPHRTYEVTLSQNAPPWWRYEGAGQMKGDLSLRALGPIVSHSFWLSHSSCAVSRILSTAPPFQQIVRGSIS